MFHWAGRVMRDSVLTINVHLRVTRNFMFADPENNAEQLVVGEGRVAADMGAGSGAGITWHLRAQSAGGRVYAIDVQKQLRQDSGRGKRVSRMSK